jgi:hypothetical protein
MFVSTGRGRIKRTIYCEQCHQNHIDGECLKVKTLEDDINWINRELDALRHLCDPLTKIIEEHRYFCEHDKFPEPIIPPRPQLSKPVYLDGSHYINGLLIREEPPIDYPFTSHGTY